MCAFTHVRLTFLAPDDLDISKMYLRYIPSQGFRQLEPHYNSLYTVARAQTNRTDGHTDTLTDRRD